jgi:O-antigen ligase
MAGIAVLGAAAFVLCSWQYYEAAIVAILVSPWINWFFYSNTPKTAEEASSEGFSSHLRILLVILIGICGTLQFLRFCYVKHVKIPKYLMLFGAFIVIAVLSGFYSIDRKYTLIRSFEFVVFFMFLLGLHGWLDERQKLHKIFNVYFWVAAIGMLANMAAMILLPGRVWDWQMPDRFMGLADQPNGFGALCLLAYPIFVWKYLNSRRAGKCAIVLLICLTLGLHVLSGSRSSLLASILGGMVWGLNSLKTMTLKHLAICMALGMGATLGLTYLVLAQPASLKRSDSTITTLTGRTEFWVGCLQLIREKPVLGYGYGVAGKIWEDPRFYREGEHLWVGSAKSSLHNGYLSLAIGLGGVGLVLWLFFSGIPICRVITLASSPYKSFILAMVFQLFVLNFFESALSSGSQIHTSLVFWFILVIAGRLPQLLARPSESIKELHSEIPLGFAHSKIQYACLRAGYSGA